MEVGINDGEVKRGDGDVERSCYCIHAPIHRALPIGLPATKRCCSWPTTALRR
jgi:hypothetical protein